MSICFGWEWKPTNSLLIEQQFNKLQKKRSRSVTYGQSLLAEAEAVGHALRSRSVGFAETLHRKAQTNVEACFTFNTTFPLKQPV
ncbi:MULTISPECIES: hypothetical protein [unclassified Moorena]|uniref:hypothetical protein n=1 Tax=unclassified Moorena TaxID=2683338 RepID=UPI0013C8114B|nr:MULTISPECIES: hypothetical protein [unclassified Moorena]NEO19407.1 hypothetical protein [Moorena sp. SIO4A5]NEQ59243.1 hypothetical protein [Moorena sp. SIO4A1]